MGVAHIISTIEDKLEDQGMTSMFLDYALNHTGGTYRMLNIRTKRIVLIRDVIWLIKTYGEYVSRKENTKANTYIFQDEYKSYKWGFVKTDTVKTEVNTEM